MCDSVAQQLSMSLCIWFKTNMLWCRAFSTDVDPFGRCLARIQNFGSWKLDNNNKAFEFLRPNTKNATKVAMPYEAQIDFPQAHEPPFGSNLGSGLLQQDRIHINLTGS